MRKNQKEVLHIAYKYYTDTEERQLLKTIKLISDTREQKNSHILKPLEEKGITVVRRALSHGDYSAILPANEPLGITHDIFFDNAIAIERKASLEELSNNLTRGRAQFENELIRFHSKGTKAFLLIENATTQDIIAHNYKTNYKPKSFMASILSFQQSYNLNIVFLPEEHSGIYIYNLLYYHVRDYIKGAN